MLQSITFSRTHMDFHKPSDFPRDQRRILGLVQVTSTSRPRIPGNMTTDNPAKDKPHLKITYQASQLDIHNKPCEPPTCIFTLTKVGPTAASQIPSETSSPFSK